MIANEFLKKKNNWSKRTSRNIDWELHYKIINKRNERSYQVKLIYIHSRLPSEKMNFTAKHTYPFCNIIESSSTPHDHFLKCDQNQQNTNNRINKIITIMKLLDIPDPLSAIIIRGIQSHYFSSSSTAIFLRYRRHQIPSRVLVRNRLR